MDYRELRKSFHEQVFPSRPNEWDIEEALDDLEDLTEEQQQILLQAIPTVWPISFGSGSVAEMEAIVVSLISRYIRIYESGTSILADWKKET